MLSLGGCAGIWGPPRFAPVWGYSSTYATGLVGWYQKARGTERGLWEMLSEVGRGTPVPTLHPEGSHSRGECQSPLGLQVCKRKPVT